VWMQFLLGTICSMIVAGVAFRKESLSLSGCIAACIVGTLIFGFGSFYWFGLLLCFFISSSVWSNFRKRQKGSVEDLFEKTGRRDALQVLANGGLATILTVVYYLYPSFTWMILYLGILSTVNADTWATEIGVLSSSVPRHILTWQPVAKGTSGGVTWLGLLGSGAGALFIGACGTLLYYFETNTVQSSLGLIGLVSGLIGACFDSILGATVQQMYFCTECRRKTEKKIHCGVQTTKISGLNGCNNDVVNVTSSVIGGVTAWVLYCIYV
jgi:uncharacterized protein (TIGR00297 family)